MSKELLRIEDLHAWYGESHILHGVNLIVHEGEVVTLLGHFVRRQLQRFFAVDFDRTFAGAREADNGAHGGRAASAVAAQQGYHFTFINA